MASVKDTLHAATSFAIIFTCGLAIGWYYSPGPMFYGEMSDSNVNLTYGNDNNFPCSDYGEQRCTFVGANQTWICTANYYENDVCTVIDNE